MRSSDIPTPYTSVLSEATCLPQVLALAATGKPCIISFASRPEWTCWDENAMNYPHIIHAILSGT